MTTAQHLDASLTRLAAAADRLATPPPVPPVLMWRVEGLKHLPAGGTRTLLSTWWGRSETGARASWRKFNPATDWDDADLTFTPEPTAH